MMMADASTKEVPCLGSGDLNIPQLGLGCMMWQQNEDDVCRIVKEAIDVGYRYFDTAAVYLTEPAIGRAIKDKIADGTVTRQDLFLTSKLPVYGHRAENIRRCVDVTLTDLGVEYIDLYLVHCPFAYEPTFELEGKYTKEKLFEKLEDNNTKFYDDNDMVTTWKVLEQCVDDGVIKHLGLSNFNSKQIQHILDNCRIKPENLQIESHPLFNNRHIIEFAQNRGITVTSFGPFGGESQAQQLLAREEILSIAEKHHQTAAQVALRFNLQRNVIVIPTTTKSHRLSENMKALDFSLDDKDMEILLNMDENKRYFTFDWAKKHKDYPFNEPF